MKPQTFHSGDSYGNEDTAVCGDCVLVCVDIAGPKACKKTAKWQFMMIFHFVQLPAPGIPGGGTVRYMLECDAEGTPIKSFTGSHRWHEMVKAMGAEDGQAITEEWIRGNCMMATIVQNGSFLNLNDLRACDLNQRRQVAEFMARREFTENPEAGGSGDISFDYGQNAQ